MFDVPRLADPARSGSTGRSTKGSTSARWWTPPQNTIGRDILESVKRGDVSGMSFGFAVVKRHGERFEGRSGVPMRIISDMRIPGVSVVTFPAYTATDVTVAQRSLQAFQAGRPTPLDMLRRRHRIRATVG